MAEQHSPATTDLLWTALLTGDPAVAGDETSSQGAVRHIADLYATPTPGAARERARQRVFDFDSIAQENTMPVSAIPISIPSWTGPAAKPDRRISALPERWRWASLAAAVLLIMAGFAGWLGYDHFGGHTTAPAVIPAVQSTPAGDWPMYRGDPARSSTVSSPGPTTAPSVLWTYSAGASAWRSPAIVGGVAYLGNANGELVALDIASGKKLWSFTGDASLEITPTVVDGMVFFPSQLGTLYALDAASGIEKWQFAKPLGEFAMPSYAEGVLFAGSKEDGYVYAIDDKTGEIVWSYDTGASIQRSTVYADGMVFTPNDDGKLIALDAKTGSVIWTVTSPDGSVYGTATYVNGVLYAGNSAFDAKTGEHQMDYANPSGEGQTPLTVANGMVFSGGWDGPLMAFDAGTAQMMWSVPTKGGGIRAIPTVGGNVVYAVNEVGELIAVDSTTGDTLFIYQLDGAVNMGPSLAGGILFVSTDAGTLFALGEGDGSATSKPPVATPVATMTGLDASQVSLVWQTAGSENDPLASPQMVSIAPDGNIYVINGGKNSVDIFSPDGTFLEAWGSEGSGPGQFQFTKGAWVNGGVDFDADGNIYVFDTYNDRVQKFAPDRTFIKEWGSRGSGNGQFVDVMGTVDATNGLVYTGDFNQRVQVFDLDGNFLDKWGNSGSGPGQFHGPLSVEVDGQGNVYVGEDEPGRVQKFDASGRFLDMSGNGGNLQGTIGIVTAMATDADDNVFVGDWSHNSVQILNSDGELIGTIDALPGGGTIETPCGIAVDGAGNLYVTSNGNGMLYKLKLPPLE